MIELKGVSWDHPRGHDCIVATSQAYSELHPEVSFTWTTRSLQDFADYPIEKLAERNDFIVLDHPFMGFGSVSGCLLPLDEWIGETSLQDQAENTVGPCFESYLYGGHYWAMAIDAACHVSAFRPDLLDGDPPRSWDDVIALAEARAGKPTGQVAQPLIPVDTLMTFLRPVAGSVSVVAVLSPQDPVVAYVAGIVLAGSTTLPIHLGKSLLRFGTNAVTGGASAPVLSAVEDVSAASSVVLAILVPALAVVFALSALFLIYRIWRRRRLRKAKTL